MAPSRRRMRQAPLLCPSDSNRMNGERILVVDHDPDHVDILSTLLRHHGYEVVARTAPDAAFATATRIRPDAVVTGLHFDGVPLGLALIDRLRADSGTAAIPIVVVSSFTDIHENQLRARSVRCVPKGPDLPLLIPALRDLLGKD